MLACHARGHGFDPHTYRILSRIISICKPGRESVQTPIFMKVASYFTVMNTDQRLFDLWLNTLTVRLRGGQRELLWLKAQRAKAVDTVISVFVSRIDRAIDEGLKAQGVQIGLMGILNAAEIYNEVEALNVPKCRVLFASTGVK